MDIFSRTEILIGKEAMERLKCAHVAVFGLGGVGGYAAEALARSGIGTLTLVDNDTISETNLNRQIIALQSTVGMKKTDAAEARIKSINPDIKIIKRDVFYLPETAESFDFSEYDYIVDAVDTVKAKLTLAENAQKSNTPIISSMGTGNKLHPEMLEIADISETSICVYSKEAPLIPAQTEETKGTLGRPVPGSTAFVPGTAGLIIAGRVINDLIR